MAGKKGKEKGKDKMKMPMPMPKKGGSRKEGRKEGSVVEVEESSSSSRSRKESWKRGGVRWAEDQRSVTVVCLCADVTSVQRPR